MRGLLGAVTLTVLAWGGSALGQTKEGVSYYSLQLGTFKSEEAAERFLTQLPEPLREEAFIYLTDSGFYTVRIWPSTDIGELKEKRRLLLRKYSLHSVIVKTDISKVRAYSRKTTSLEVVSAGKNLYSIQLGTFKKPSQAKAFLSSLPDTLRREAFVYVTDTGFYTVRIWPSGKISLLKEKLKELRAYSLSGIIVKTSPEKIPKREAFTVTDAGTEISDSPSSLSEELDKVKEDDSLEAPSTTVYYFSVSGEGAQKPAVSNRNRLAPGTWENRRVEVEIYPLASKSFKRKISLGDVIEGGVYSVNLKLSHLYPARLSGTKFYLKLPENTVFVVGSVKVNGKPVKGRVEKGVLEVELGEFNGDRPVEVSFKLLAKGKTVIKSLPYCFTGRLKSGKRVFISRNKDFFKEFLLSRSARLKKIKELPKKSPVPRAKVGITYPDADVVLPDSSTDIRFAVPIGSKFEFTVNGSPVPKKYLAEKSTDKARGVVGFTYVGVPLLKGENRIVLKVGEKEFVRKVFVSGEISDFRFSLYPERPAADGRSSAYVVIDAYDKEGKPVKVSTYLKVYVDRGDIYDYRTGTYKKFVNDGFKVKLVDGRAVVRLSPAKHPEERILKVVYGDIEREFRVRYYPEKRPWLVVGELEGSVGFSSTHNSPSKLTDMPYDHSKSGVHVRGRGALFAKGTVKDYTVTLRYDTKRPDNTLLKQNIPSTEEGQFYPVYGDDSEQYFEAKSKRHLYLRVDKGLSYFLFGDYNTGFGKEFDFNRYSRTFNGILINLESSDNYRIKGFVTKNSQDIVKDEFKGKGTSGPFFLSSRPIEFSEKVWIEVRDRYNPDVVIERKRLNRFTDYDINYDEGFIILHQPLPEFDRDLNPEYLIVTYETEELSKKEYMYGLRGEKWIKGVRFGLFGVREEHPEKDKELYGFDLYYYRSGFKVIGEFAHSSGFEGEEFTDTSGNAFRGEISYSQKNFQGRLFYKKVEDGFQNPSSMTAEERYTNYGFNLTRDFGTLRLSANGLVDDRENMNRKEADILLTKRLTDKLSIDVGARYNREESDSGTVSYGQGIAGLQFSPTDKLSLLLRREQSIGGDKESSYFPTRTILKANYRWSEKTSTYLQTEVRELPEGTNSLTTVGINSQLDENTTAYSKYTVDDGSSGWRTQSHIGLNHVFKLRDDLSVDFGLENVHTFSGDEESRDYTSLRLRGLYTQSERYKLSGEYQIRFGDVKTEHLLRVGGVFKPTPDYTLLLRDRFFISDYRENEILLGLARRPVSSDKLNYLLKLRWKVSDRDETTNKYIFSYHVNWQPKKKLTLMGEYAAKYVDVKDVGTSFTDLIRGRVLYDVTDRLDFGFHAGLMRQTSTDTYTLSWGPEVGYVLFENFWISLGYNFNGFKDDDFDDAKYWAKGFYVKFRLKFDESYLRKLKLLKKFKGGS